MKVILLKNVPSLGSAGDIKEVATGFARNVLIPRKQATLATPDAIARTEKKKHQLEREAAMQQKTLEEISKKLSATTVTFTRPANDQDKLFASIDAKTIASELSAKHGITIDQNQIIIKTPIKQVGNHVVDYALSKSQSGVFTVTVKKEK